MPPRPVLDQDAGAAGRLARGALALTAGLSRTADGDGPLAEVRRAAAADAATARVILAGASSRAGAHATALPVLEAAHAQVPQDEPLLADLLRAEAAVSGAAVALERFERYRRDLRDRLGPIPVSCCSAPTAACSVLTARSAGGCATTRPS
jgi:Bacterial transcriptional activator domain